MNILKKITNKFAKKDTPQRGWVSLSDVFGSGFTGGKLTSYYKSFAYACINARAENVAKAKIYLYKQGTKGEIIEVKKHPFLDVMRKSNQKKQSFKELLQLISTSLDLYGKAYLYVQRGVRGEPLNMYHLPSKMVTEILDGQGLYVDYYLFNGVKYSADDIITCRIPDPDNSFNGKSTVSAFNYTLDVEYNQNKFQNSFYESGALMDLIHETESRLGDPEFQRLKTEVDDGYRGVKNSGKTLLLENGLKAKSFQQSMKDVELVPARKQIRDEILTVFRVPKTMLGIADDVNRANAAEAIKMFTEFVIKPFAELCIESKFNIFLQENYKDENLYMEFEYTYQADRDLQIKTLEFYKSSNMWDEDEIRAIEGYGARENQIKQ